MIAPLYIVRRDRGMGFNYSLEFGDHRCHSDRSRDKDNPNVKRRKLPDGWIGTLSEAVAIFEADEAREASTKAPPAAKETANAPAQ